MAANATFVVLVSFFPQYEYRSCCQLFTSTSLETLLLPYDQLNLRVLTSAMNSGAEEEQWFVRLQNDEMLSFALYNTLSTANTVLQLTSLKNRVVAPGRIPAPAVLDQMLSDEDKTGWKSFPKNVLQTKDWDGFITKSRLYSSLCTVCKLLPYDIAGAVFVVKNA